MQISFQNLMEEGEGKHHVEGTGWTTEEGSTPHPPDNARPAWNPWGVTTDTGYEVSVTVSQFAMQFLVMFPITQAHNCNYELQWARFFLEPGATRRVKVQIVGLGYFGKLREGANTTVMLPTSWGNYRHCFRI